MITDAYLYVFHLRYVLGCEPTRAFSFSSELVIVIRTTQCLQNYAHHPDGSLSGILSRFLMKHASTSLWHFINYLICGSDFL